MIELNSNNFREVVLKEQEKPVIVDFWADWCGPCKSLMPAIEALCDDPNIVVGKVNVDTEQDLVSECSVRNVPTVIIYHKGKVVEKLVGVHLKSEYQKLLNKYK